jgi:hypothetical protein
MYMYYLLKNHDFQVGNTLTLKTNFGGANLVAWSKSLCPDPQKTYNFNVKSEEKNVTNLYMFHSIINLNCLKKKKKISHTFCVFDPQKISPKSVCLSLNETCTSW